MKNTFMYVYNGGRRNLKYFYSQTMAVAVVVVHTTMFLLEQEGFFCYLITSLGSILNKGFCISWTHFSDQCPALKDALASSDSTWMVVFLGKFAWTANFIMKVKMKIVILGKFGFGWPFLWKNFVRIVPWPKLFSQHFCPLSEIPIPQCFTKLVTVVLHFFVQLEVRSYRWFPS